MLQFFQDLPDDYQFFIVWWGQSNSRPWGSKAEGFSEAPHLSRTNKAGFECALIGISAPINGISVVGVSSPTLLPSEWVGANFRNGTPGTSPRTGYGTIVANSVSSLTVKWFGTAGEPSVPDQASAAGYITRDDEKWKYYENIRILTPYQPELLNTDISGPTIPYPTGTPVIPGYTVPPQITSYEDLGLFLEYTFLEGIDGDGAIGNGVWVANKLSYVDVSGHLSNFAANTLVGGYIRAGNSRARIASNTADASAVVTFTGGGSPVINWVHTFVTPGDLGRPVTFTTDGTLPAEISPGQTYYISSVPSAVTLHVSATPLGPDIVFAGAGVGNHTGHAAGEIKVIGDAAGWTGGVPSSSVASSYQAWIGHYANNPHAFDPGDGFRYPNNDMMPSAFATTSQGVIHHRPRGDNAIAGGGTASSIFSAFSYGDRFGSLLECAYRISTIIGKPINVIHLGINSAAQILANTQNFFGFKGQIGWWNYNSHLDWTPGNPGGCFARLRRLIEVVAPAAIEMEGGDPTKFKCLGIFGQQGEGDAIVEEGRNTYATSIRTFYDELRDVIASSGQSLWGKDRIPITHSKPTTVPWGLTGFYPAYGVTLDGDAEGLVRAAIDDMVRQDPYAATWDPDDPAAFPKLTNDAGHFNGVGEARNGVAAAEAWQGVAVRAASASPTFDIPTLAEMREAVLDVAQRNTNSTDAGVIATVNRAINDSLHGFLNELGDIAWFLRRTERMTLSGSPTTVTELPSMVRRLIEVRDPSDPLVEYNFTLRGFGNNGRMQVTFLESIPGSVDVVHIYQPRDLATDDDRPILAREYVEAVVVSAARRLLSNSGNANLEIKVTAREEKLILRAREHAQKVDRALRQKVSGTRTKGSASNRFVTDVFGGPPNLTGY